MNTRDRLDMLAQIDPKRLYRNIEELYYRAWDPLTELAQNSLASILERLASDKSFHKGMISLTIDAEKRRIRIEDNGGGFDDLVVVAANRTTRELDKGTPFSGFGLGLSSILARSDRFSIRSVNAKKVVHQAEWVGARASLRDPSVNDLKPATCRDPRPATTKEAVSTVIEVEGVEGFEELWGIAADKPDRLLEVLKAHTAIGHTCHVWNPAKRPSCNYKVTILGGSKPVHDSGSVGFPFVLPGSVGTFDFAEHDKDPSKVPAKEKLIVYVRKGRQTEHKPFKVNLYVACEVDRKLGLLKKHFGDYIESLDTNRILLSIDGFPQSFQIDRPSERQTRALWGNIFAIVEVDKNVVEPGRNKISDLHYPVIRGVLVEAINKLDALAIRIRENEEFTNAINIAEAVKSAESAASQGHLSYNLPNDITLHMEKVPQQEQEVIGLFCELLGHELIPDCTVLSIGSGAFVYDSYLRLRYKYRNIPAKLRPKKDEGKHTLDLKLDRDMVLPTEFKVSAGLLADEIHKGKTRKKLDQIQLVVCWTEGVLPTGFTLDPIGEDERFFPAATHRLHRASPKASCEVVVLREWLDQLEQGTMRVTTPNA